MSATTSDTPRPTPNSPRLVTLERAIEPYDGLTVPMLRAWIRRGELAAVKAGKGYLVAPEDVAARLRPQLRQQAERRVRETETQRAERQLAEAGIG